ncbi:MAG: hypothetical protein HDT36_03600, partial [Clostridiales bacterium]|nr:hypothetical protein [Clostridiales bacterium]
MKSKTQIQNSEKSNPKSKKRKKILIATLSCLVLLPLLSIAIAVATFAAWANTQHVDKYLLPTATALPVYYDVSGNELPSEQSDFVEPNEISDNLKNAFVALEDKRFYSHKGYDIVRMGGAAVKNIKAGGIREGASTITQQLVKNTHLTQERTLSRKLKELAIAIQLEKEYDKDEILSMYLSVIYFGNGAYGVKQAASTYFSKTIDELDLSECAILAGIVRNPSKYSPFSNIEECKSRRNVALSVMREQGYIDEDTYQNTIAMPILTKKDRTNNNDNLSAKTCEFYLAQVQNEVCEKLNMTKYQLSNSGLKIYTNLDSSLQAELEKHRHDVNNYESDLVNSVSIVLDNQSGAVLAYSSSYPYSISRQAGSVLKPLAVYAPALDCNLVSLATPIVDEKIDFGGFCPSNYGGTYYGDTTVREAIKKSMNSVSVKVLDYIGVDRSASYLDSFGIGISDADKNYALALGATSKGVSPLSVAGGYSTLARNGEYIKPSFVRYIVDNGSKVYANDSYQNVQYQSSRVISSGASALITSALVDTVNDGTAKSLSVLPFEVAAKTGTAQRSDGSNSDAWCASYNSEYTVLVWHGNDEGMSERGGGYPTRHTASIWKSVSSMKQVTRSFTYPDTVVLKDVDTYSSKINKQVVAATENTPL